MTTQAPPATDIAWRTPAEPGSRTISQAAIPPMPGTRKMVASNASKRPQKWFSQDGLAPTLTWAVSAAMVVLGSAWGSWWAPAWVYPSAALPE